MTHVKKRKIYFITFWMLAIPSFIFLSIFLVVYANGYNFNPKTMHLEKTAMIILNGKISKPYSISINNENKLCTLSCKFGRLLPGRYEIKIDKDKYQSWSKVVYLSGGQAFNINDIILFLSEPTISEVSNNGKNIEDTIKKYQNQNSGISILNNEIKFQDKLITRFSQNVLSAVYDKQYNRFYFQIGSEMRTIDFDGGNNVLLFTLPSSAPISFYIDNENIFYISDNKLYQAIVR